MAPRFEWRSTRKKRIARKRGKFYNKVVGVEKCSACELIDVRV